jgi:hypothetical protein
MAAGKYNFTIEQGATVDFAVQYKDSNSNPIDLSGYQARMQLRPTIGSSTVILTLSSSLGIDGTGLNLSGSGGLNASTPPTSGSVGVFVSAATSSLLTFDSAVVTRLIEGIVKLSKNITLGGF